MHVLMKFTNTHRTCAHAAARPPWRGLHTLVPDSPALRPRAPMQPGLALTPNVVLVPRTNIAAWVWALGRLCIVVTGAGLEMTCRELRDFAMRVVTPHRRGRRRDRVEGEQYAEQKEERGGRWRWDIRAETSRSWQLGRHVAGFRDTGVERQWWAKARWRRATSGA
ncbi:hypothetical protein C8J57DRAFT_1479961 [Mycena rebaudengoi]|nr:hypothetical protein C8J57DRAFT_1479961 [Mycena rebaudengoi]